MEVRKLAPGVRLVGEQREEWGEKNRGGVCGSPHCSATFSLAVFRAGLELTERLEKTRT